MRAARRDFATLLFIQIQGQILNIIKALIPVIERLDVHRADPLVALFPQQCHQGSADEATGPGHYY
jgi:hypothetical protein